MNKSRNFIAGACFVLGAASAAMPAHSADVKVTGEFGWFGVGKAIEGISSPLCRQVCPGRRG